MSRFHVIDLDTAIRVFRCDPSAPLYSAVETCMACSSDPAMSKLRARAKGTDKFSQTGENVTNQKGQNNELRHGNSNILTTVVLAQSKSEHMGKQIIYYL